MPARRSRSFARLVHLLCFGLLPSVALAGPWTNINPGGGGAFTAIGAGPTGTIICASDLSGACRSRDRGLTWDVIGADRGLKRTHVSAVGFDPLDAQIIHLGTEVGIYRSADGGDSFQQVLTTGYIGAVAPARSNPSIVYAAWHPAWNTNGPVIYKSTNRGLTWAPLASDLPDTTRILKLVVSPTHPNTLYLVSGNDLFVAATQALYRSIDGGIHWTRLGASLGHIWDLAMDPVTPSTLYVTVYQGIPRSSWSGWVYKSTDGGDTWTQKATHTGAILVKRSAPQVVRVIDVDRGSSESEGGVWESLNGGDTWQKKSTMTGWDSGWMKLDWAYDGGAYGMAKTLGEDLSDPDVIYWVSWQFAFGSTDGGGRFVNLVTTETSPGRWRSRGIDNVTLASLAISEASPSEVYAGYHDLGLWRSLDGGASWQTGNNVALTGSWKGNGGNAISILADPARSGVVWAANGERGDSTNLARSTSAGAPSSWVPAIGLPGGFQRGLSLDRAGPVSPRTLFVTTNGDVYRSQDDGVTWAMVFDCNGCRATAVDRFDGTLVYAGGEAGLWRSPSSGAAGTWVRVGPPELAGGNPKALSAEQWEGVHQIVHDPTRTGWAYVAAYGSGRGIYRTTDRGATWARLRNATYMRDVALDPVDPNVIYAAGSRALKSGSSASGSEGLLRSQDGGQTWASLNDGLPWPFAARIAVDPANHLRLILGSPGAGFFERTLPGQAVAVEPPTVPGDLSLSSAFPDPSRAAVAFTLRLARPTRVEWSVHDLQGRMIWSGAERRGPGAVTLTWDPAQARGARPGGGIYFARFNVEGRVHSRRFALLR
jgi:hypothetical protein